MDTSQVIITILVGLFLVFSQVLATKYVQPSLPDKKKFVSFLIETFYFLWEYGIPITFIILVTIYMDFGKGYVLIVSFSLTTILYALVKHHLRRILDIMILRNTDFDKRIRDLNSNINKKK